MTEREYNSIHQWNLRHWVKKGVCEHCRKTRKTQWSNKTGRYIKGYRSDWQELCIRCHTDYDVKYLERRIKVSNTKRVRRLTRRDYLEACKKECKLWGSKQAALRRLQQYVWYQ